VRLRNQLQEAWRQVDVELNRRYDLVPNLVETVKGAAGYEASTLEKVIGLRNQARALASSDAPANARAGVEGQLSQALTSVVATAEAYPELRANASFTQLSGQLSATEDRIANSRRYYNALVGRYNTKTESFPSMIFAARFSFQKAGYFQVEDASVRANVDVDFSALHPGVAPAAPSVSFQQSPATPPISAPNPDPASGDQPQPGGC
jgi:LemA protein